MSKAAAPTPDSDRLEAYRLDPLDPLLEPVWDVLGRLRRKPSAPVACRWWLKGVNGHLLPTLKIAGKRYTTPEALRRFILAIQGPPASVQTVDTTVQNQLAAAGYTAPRRGR